MGKRIKTEEAERCPASSSWFPNLRFRPQKLLAIREVVGDDPLRNLGGVVDVVRLVVLELLGGLLVELHVPLAERHGVNRVILADQGDRRAIPDARIDAQRLGNIPRILERAGEVARRGGNAAVLEVVLAETGEHELVLELVSHSRLISIADERGETGDLILLGLLADDVGDLSGHTAGEGDLVRLGLPEDLLALSENLEVIRTAGHVAVGRVALDLEGSRSANGTTSSCRGSHIAVASLALGALGEDAVGRLARELPGVGPGLGLGRRVIVVASGERAGGNNSGNCRNHALLHLVFSFPESGLLTLPLIPFALSATRPRSLLGG